MFLWQTTQKVNSLCCTQSDAMRASLLLLLLSFTLLEIVGALNKYGGNVPIPNSIPQNVKQALSAQLSDNADVAIPGEDLYDELNIKYSDFNRPTYAAIVAVASIQDVVETV